MNSARSLYLEKEDTGKIQPKRFTMEHWEDNRSYHFLQKKRKWLESPVADFGCGHGPLSILTARMGFEVTAFDCIHDNIVNGNAKKTDSDTVTFVECFLDDIPAEDDSFNSGICKEVLEHIIAPDLPKVLAEFKRVLKPGAPLIVTVPRETIFKSVARDEHVTFFHSPAMLAKFLKKHGFKILKKEYNRVYKRTCVIVRNPQNP